MRCQIVNEPEKVSRRIQTTLSVRLSESSDASGVSLRLRVQDLLRFRRLRQSLTRTIFAFISLLMNFGAI